MHSSDRGSVFVTLTYDPENLPSDWSLQRPSRGEKHDPEGRPLSDFQLFMRRLRKARSKDRLKYYMCGEYGAVCRHDVNLEEKNCVLGCKVGRPHYHACIFNAGFPDRFQYSSTRDGEPRFTSPELRKLWGKGHVDVGEVTMQSAGYVARYCLKKVTGEAAEDHYSSIDAETGEINTVLPEYAAMSNGIGSDWYEEFKSDVFPSGEVPVPGSTGKIYRKVPRYYDEKLRVENEQLYDDIKSKRKAFATEHPEEFTPERLQSKYRVKRAQLATLKRELE